MKNDLEIIQHKLSTKHPYINIYGIGDIHIGSKEFDEKVLKKKLDTIKNDPNGYFVICGDCMDFGIPNAKTNVMEEVMQPFEQKEFLYDIMQPYIDKCLAIVPGNHERRAVKTVGFNPLYDVACRWQVEDIYRENLALIKLGFGRNHKKEMNWYGVGVSHGSTVNKHRKYEMCFDGLDAFISGHTHSPSYTPLGKIRVNLRAGTATKVPYKELVVDSGLESGGYALANEYVISAPPEIQYLRLNKIAHSGNFDTKKIDFGAIQL